MAVLDVCNNILPRRHPRRSHPNPCKALVVIVLTAECFQGGITPAGTFNVILGEIVHIHR
ncbi:hypothetical protein SPHINGO8AM_90111 [Sphingomonas sp. 8AM]|nr:hypothetical protein SPHINGO8AM_90111 [Sphingomonas sp. 8AM]